MPGFTELLLLLVILVLIFGATKLPKLGASIGRTVKNFKQAPTFAAMINNFT